MVFTRDIVHFKINELWTSADSWKRAEANKYLLEFQESTQAWQVCSELLRFNSEPEVQYIAAQTLCKKLSNNNREVIDNGGSKIVFEQIYLKFISEYLENSVNDTGNISKLTSPFLSKIGEGLSYLIITGVIDGSWTDGFEKCIRIKDLNCGLKIDEGNLIKEWIILNMFRYIPDSCSLLDNNKKQLLIENTLPKILDYISECITCILSNPVNNCNDVNKKLLDLMLDILIEYFEKFEIPLFNHKALSVVISKLLETDFYIAPYRLAELFVRGLPRCSYYMQKQGNIVDSLNCIYKLIEDSNSNIHITIKFPNESETVVIASLLKYLKKLYEKLRQIPVPSNVNNVEFNTNNNDNNCNNGSNQMIRINTWSTLKMNVPQIDLDEETERSILSWSGVVFSLLEGYPLMFVVSELPEIKNFIQNKKLENPLFFLSDMLLLLLTLNIRIPGVLVNMWCTLRDILNEGIINKDQAFLIASTFVTPAIQTLATQSRTDFYYWEREGINENSILNARIVTYSNFGLKDVKLNDSLEEFLDFLDTVSMHINDIYFFLQSIGTSHSYSFMNYIQHSLLACSNENDPLGCVVFLRFLDTLIESSNTLEGITSSIIELSCTSIPRVQSCMYQVTLLIQKSAHLFSDSKYSQIWLLCIKYLIDISQTTNLVLVSTTFEELCQFGVDHIKNDPNCYQILYELSQSIIQVINLKLKFSSDGNLYNNISKIDENIGYVGGYSYLLCYTMLNNKNINDLSDSLKSFIYHTINITINNIPSTLFSHLSSPNNNENMEMTSQCCYIWSIFVLLKILKSCMFCMENNLKNESFVGDGVNISFSDNNLSNSSNMIPVKLSLLLGNIFSKNDQEMYILGEKLKSLLFNSFNLYSESQGFGVVLISNMMYQHTRNISLHNLMVCTRRSFTGSDNCLSCPKDIIISMCCLILRYISFTWSSSVVSELSGNISTKNDSIVNDQWCTWECTYNNIKKSILYLKNDLNVLICDQNNIVNNNSINNNEINMNNIVANNNTVSIKQRHGGCTLLIHEILKKVNSQEKDEIVNIMHNDGIDTILYEFWINKFYTISNYEISRSIEPFFLWQTSQLGTDIKVTSSLHKLLTSSYFIYVLDIGIRSLQFNDKQLINTILIYLTKLSNFIHTIGQNHIIWNGNLNKLIAYLMCNYHKYDGNNLMLQTCKLLTSIIDFYPDIFFQTINEMYSKDYSQVYPELSINPFYNIKQDSIINFSFKTLRGPKLRQFITDFANITNGIINANDFLNKYQVLLSSSNNGTISSVPIVIS
ncbi:hypothetical protein FG386_000999 [Cryptosporidium ryanae]|uniref:uncharacterized protein n=1 Tax=Cryptosporidium ryanae TaxID=515981 RepID=UPI003519DB53|nr:hypothetical protein FG386_000999 [Cryptosporidium ryanae]